MDPIRRYVRLLRIQLAARRAPAIDPFDVSTVSDRVVPTDIDELRHMNNGVYLSLLDHARLDLMARSGIWRRFRAAGVYPVVSAQTITYRKSLTLGQRFDIESRILGFDARSVFLEQRFVVRGEIYARAIVAGRFLRERGGVVPLDELGALAGIDPAAHPVPDWVGAWSAGSALPSTRAAAPSAWGDPPA